MAFSVTDVTQYVGFDLETTGVNPFCDAPVSYSFVEHERSNGEGVSRIECGFTNPGVPIPAEATAIHGICDSMVEDAPNLDDSLERIAGRLTQIWAGGGVIVGMNVSYDLTMIDSLCRRLGVEALDQRGCIGAVIDILILDRHYDKWRKGPRKLTDLSRHYGVTLSNAHAADADADASLLVFEAMRHRFPEIDLICASDINPTLRQWHQEWLTSFSTYLVKKGEAPISPGRYEWPIQFDE